MFIEQKVEKNWKYFGSILRILALNWMVLETIHLMEFSPWSLGLSGAILMTQWGKLALMRPKFHCKNYVWCLISKIIQVRGKILKKDPNYILLIFLAWKLSECQLFWVQNANGWYKLDLCATTLFFSKINATF